MIKEILILLLLSLNLFSQYPIKVEVKKEDKYIMGANRIDVEIKLKNVSGRELELAGAPGYFWYLGDKLCTISDDGVEIAILPGDPPISKSGGAYKRIPKDWEKIETHNILWTNLGSKCRLEKEGLYDFYYVYRDTLGERDLTERVKVEINYVMPEGIDREAYEYFKGHPLAKPNELLEKYPTSTYAGWALRYYRFEYNVIDPFNNEKAREEIIRYKDKVIEFLNFHKDFIFAGNLASSAAYICSQIGDYRCACDLYKEAFTLRWELPGISENERERVKERKKTMYEKLKKESKCK